MEMGRNETQALGVLRLSFGPGSTEADIDSFLTALPSTLQQAQALDKLDQRSKKKRN